MCSSQGQVRGCWVGSSGGAGARLWPSLPHAVLSISLTHLPHPGGQYHKPGSSEALKPGSMLGSLLQVVPELRSFASMHLKVAFNLDSCNVGPKQWVQVRRAGGHAEDGPGRLPAAPS